MNPHSVGAAASFNGILSVIELAKRDYKLPSLFANSDKAGTLFSFRSTTDKKIIWGLSIVAVLLLISTFSRQYSESKIGEYKNEVAILQNNLNAELGRVLYYMITANQHENLSLLVTINKSIDVNSIISPNVNPTDNRAIDLIEQKKNDLKRQLKEKQITPSSYYNERLKIDCSLYEEHFNIYDKLNGDLNNKLQHGSIWSFWNSFFILVEFVCILINVLGQSYLIITIYKKTNLKIFHRRIR